MFWLGFFAGIAALALITLATCGAIMLWQLREASIEDWSDAPPPDWLRSADVGDRR